MDYENENCTGCTCIHIDAAGEWMCLAEPDRTCSDVSDTNACERFQPSLQCRQVRALERIADRFAPVASPSMTVAAVRAVEAWVEYEEGRGGTGAWQLALCAYKDAKDDANR